MTVDVIAIVTAKEGNADRVQEILVELAGNVNKHEHDVLRYVPTKVVNPAGTHEFVVIERYKDQATLDAHFTTDYFQAVGKKIGDEGLLAKPLNIMTVQPLGGFENR